MTSHTFDTASREWFDYNRPRPRTALTLVCFPYAGGSSLAFRNWGALLPDNVSLSPVKLPGRGDRLSEAPYGDLKAIVSEAARGLAQHIRPPYALFGHSMGALLAFEVALELRGLAAPSPVALIVSGCRAPHLPPAETAAPTLSELPDAEFIDELRKLGGTQDHILSNPELMAILLPILRADFRVVETYRHIPQPPLNCPVFAFGGRSDAEASAAEIDAWKIHTCRFFASAIFPGGHFFLHEQEGMFVEACVKSLQSVAAIPPGPNGHDLS